MGYMKKTLMDAQDAQDWGQATAGQKLVLERAFCPSLAGASDTARLDALERVLRDISISLEDMTADLQGALDILNGKE